MAGDRTGGRRIDRRAFRPTLDGRLESRSLLSHGGVHVGIIRAQTARGGQSIIVTDTDSERYQVTALDGTAEAPTAVGATVWARAARGGLVDLVVFGSTVNTELLIEPVPHPGLRQTETGLPRFLRGKAHDFPLGSRNNDGLLHVNSIRVVSGRLGSISAFRTADLSGPVVVADTTPVDRIAFADLLPGAAIRVGGDLDTLSVLNDIDLRAAPGAPVGPDRNLIDVGRDLNVINVGHDVLLRDGASVTVRRNLGLVPQPPKFSDPGGRGGVIEGDLVVGPGSALTAGFVVAPIQVVGDIVRAGTIIPVNAAV